MQHQPMKMLEDEHRVILSMVGVMAAPAEELAAGRPVEADMLRAIVDFMRT